MKIYSVVPTLRAGGAEVLLLLFARRTTVPHDIAAIIKGGELESFQDGSQPRIWRIVDGSLWQTAKNIRGLIKDIRDHRPFVVLGWLCHGALLGWAIARLLRGRVIWYFHAADFDSFDFRLRTRIVMQCLRLISRIDAVPMIFCAHAAKLTHESLGFRIGRNAVVENAVDFARFVDMTEDDLAAAAHRDVVLVPMRADPQKDIQTMLKLAGDPQFQGLRFLICGRGMTLDTPIVKASYLDNCQPSNVHFIGFTPKMGELYFRSKLVFVSARYGEAMPLTVLEGLWFGRPVVAPDLGDLGQLRDQLPEAEALNLYTPGDATAAAVALAKSLEVSDRVFLKNRRFIEDYYSPARFVANLEVWIKQWTQPTKP